MKTMPPSVEDRKVKGYLLSSVSSFKVALLAEMRGGSKSQVADDAIRLLWAMYAILPPETVNAVLDTLDNPDSEKTISEVSQMINDLLYSAKQKV